jgi:membrane protease YdiL (CAAX protease family)
VVIVAVAAVALTASRYHLGPLVGRAVEALAPDIVSGGLLAGWKQVALKLARGLVLLGLPLAAIALLRRPLRDFGFVPTRARDWLRDIGILYVAMLPLLFWAMTQPSFQRTYPYFRLARLGLGYFTFGLGVRLVYMFCWEFFFRGWLLFGFERKVGPAAAIAVSTLPFVIMHFGKPAPEVYGSIIAGVILGIVALRSRSFIPAAILHFAVAATLDIIALVARAT